MNSEPSDSDLARLADGSLSEAQARDMRARVLRSPELQARLREQERAVTYARQAAQITAPAALHAAIGEQIAARSSSVRATRSSRVRASFPLPSWSLGPTWNLVPAGLVAATIAAIVVVVVLVTGGHSLTVDHTARLALAAPTREAPTADSADTDLLSLKVGSIAFPAYEGRSDWRAIGARTDEVDGHRVQTVFYDIAGERVGYSIVAGSELTVPRGTTRSFRGVRYVLTNSRSAELITWRRDGHTCVIAGSNVSSGTLLTLADATQLSA